MAKAPRPVDGLPPRNLTPAWRSPPFWHRHCNSWKYRQWTTVDRSGPLRYGHINENCWLLRRVDAHLRFESSCLLIFRMSMGSTTDGGTSVISRQNRRHQDKIVQIPAAQLVTCLLSAAHAVFKQFMTSILFCSWNVFGPRMRKAYSLATRPPRAVCPTPLMVSESIPSTCTKACRVTNCCHPRQPPVLAVPQTIAEDVAVPPRR